MPVHICLIDDHPIFLDGVRHVLKTLDENYEPHCFLSPLEALAAIDEGIGYDLILVDLVMSELNGLAFLRALRSRNVTTPVAILSGTDTFPPIRRAVEGGARGFIPKSASTEDLHRGIATVLDGEIYLPDELWESLDGPSAAGGARSGEEVVSAPCLSQRQREILTLLAEGNSNRQIGEVLRIAENTVKTHIKNLYRMLGVTRRTECVQKARSLGYLACHP